MTADISCVVTGGESFILCQMTVKGSTCEVCMTSAAASSKLSRAADIGACWEVFLLLLPSTLTSLQQVISHIYFRQPQEWPLARHFCKKVVFANIFWPAAAHCAWICLQLEFYYLSQCKFFSGKSRLDCALPEVGS